MIFWLESVFRFQFLDESTREKIENKLNNLLNNSARKHIYLDKVNNLKSLLKNSKYSENHLICNYFLQFTF